MRDKTTIALGLGVFVVAVTFPIWYGIAAGGDAAAPALPLPAHATNCVESKQWMIANHPKLLSDWREAVVRQGAKEYTSKTYGTHHQMSLTKTCIECHGSRQQFCDKCHTYANVTLNCWGCHQEVAGGKSSSPSSPRDSSHP
jgi:hypothetical protein